MNKLSILLLTLVFVSCGVSKTNSVASTLVYNQEKTTFYMSDSTLFIPKSFYPKFSWNVTPQYCMFGDGNRLLTSKEIKTITGISDFICIEKSHAFRKLKYAEIGAKEEIAALKKVKPSIKALFYFNSAYAWPFTSYNKNFTKNKIDQYPELKSYLITNKETGELEKRNTTYYFDVLNSEFRKWWVKTVVNGVHDSGADGVFIDQMHGFFWLRKSQKREVERAMGEMMVNLKKALEPNKILLGNNASHVEEVLPAIDAAMFEHYGEKKLTKENLLKEWNYMLTNAKVGKMSVFRIGVEAEDEKLTNSLSGSAKEEMLEEMSKDRLEYYQACYLIGAQPYSYFQYGWGWRLGTGPLVDYSTLYKKLGAPIAAYKRTTENSWEFTREFKYANVWVNTESKKAKITWFN